MLLFVQSTYCGVPLSEEDQFDIIIEFNRIAEELGSPLSSEEFNEAVDIASELQWDADELQHLQFLDSLGRNLELSADEEQELEELSLASLIM